MDETEDIKLICEYMYLSSKNNKNYVTRHAYHNCSA